MITRPCAGCGITIHVPSVSDRHCGPACAEVDRLVQESHERGLKPGHKDFYSLDPKEARKHNRKISRRHKV